MVAVDITRIFRERVSESLDLLYIVRLVFVRDENSSGIYVGTGVEGESFLPSFRIGNDIAIPISSFKGVLRRIAESLAKQVFLYVGGSDIDVVLALAHCEPEDDIVRHVCYDVLTPLRSIVKLDESCGQLVDLGVVPEDKVDEICYGIKRNDVEITRALEPFLASLCPICRLFGGPGLEGKLKIWGLSVSVKGIHVQPHVSINRATRTAATGALYSQEVVDIDKVYVDLSIINVRPGTAEGLIIAQTLKFLKNIGLWIGGSRSRGLGWYRLNKEESIVYVVNLENITDAEKLAQELVDPERYAKKIDLELFIQHLLGGM